MSSETAPATAPAVRKSAARLSVSLEARKATGPRTHAPATAPTPNDSKSSHGKRTAAKHCDPAIRRMAIGTTMSVGM